MATANVVYPALDLSKIIGKTRKLVSSDDVMSDVTSVDWGIDVFGEENEEECVKSET